ncbi:MAG: cupredoxin family copper-binding protein [Steroidobacteraceae bacterium]
MAATLLMTLAATAAAGASPRLHVIVVENMRFNPQQITVNRGDRIRWVNRDLFPHTATASNGAFDSHEIAVQGTWTYVAARAGEYDYLCVLHPTMKGRIHVR